MPKIIPVMKNLGYSPTEQGVCFGIATMGAQAVIREEPKAFYNRINRIHNLTSENIESILKKRESGKTDDLFYFFDGISIYHGLASVTEKVKKASNLAIPRQSIDNKFLLKNHNKVKEDIEIQDNEFNFVDVKERLICSMTIKDLNRFILQLKSELKNTAFSLMIHFADALHTVQLGLSNNNWLVVNHDFVKIYDENVDIDDLIKGLLLHLKLKKDYKLNAAIDILLSEQTNIDLSWVKEYELTSSQIIEFCKDKKSLVNLIKCCAFANQHQLLKKIFRNVDIVAIANEIINNELPLAMLLAETGDSHIETTNVFLNVIKNSKLSLSKCALLLKGRSANNIDALYMAVWRGYKKTVKAFLQAIEEIAFTDDLRMSLLRTSNNENRSTLFVAAYKGHTEIFKAVLESIQRSGFDKIKLLSLFNEKDCGGFSILYAAINSGNKDIIVALAQRIDNSSFSDDEKVALLESRNKEGVPILFFAFVENEIKIVKYLIEYIISSKIKVNRKIRLLQANVPSFNTSLYKYAKESGNEDFVQYLENIIANSPQFTKLQKGRILRL